MNNRLAIIGGGSFTVLLVLFAALSVTHDDSALSSNTKNTFLSLSEITTFAELNLPQPGDSSSLQAVNPTQKANNTRLSQAISYIVNSMVDTSASRMQAILNTDKLIYRANDTLFIEVLLIDTIKNGPITFPNNSTNVNDTFVTVELGIADVYGQAVYTSEFNITNTTGPAGSVVFKLPQNISNGDYAIRVAGYEFSPASKIITVRATSSNNNIFQGVDGQSFYNISIQLIDYNPPTLNGSLWGKIVLSTVDGAPIPSDQQVQLFITYGNNTSSSAMVYNLSQDGSCYFTASTNYTLFNSSYYLTLSAFADLGDLGQFYSDDKLVSFGGVPPMDPLTNGNQNTLDPHAIKVYFQHESLSDLVFNATQKVYVYSFINYEDDNLTDQFFTFGKGQIRAYNQTNMTLAPVNVTDVIQSANGFASFIFTPKELLTYFLEIQVGSQIETQSANDVNMNSDNTTMDGPHIFTNGTVRIPLIVQGFQSRRQRFNQNIDQQMHPEDYQPTFDMDILDNLNFTVNDTETGFTFMLSNDAFTVGYAGLPPLLVFNSFPNPANFSNTLGFFYKYAQGFYPALDGSLTQTAQVQTVTFNASQVVAKFISYTAQAINQTDSGNFTLLGLLPDNMTQNIEVLTTLFPGSGQVTANIFGTYGPDWLKSKCVQNTTNNQSAPPTQRKVQSGPEVSVSVLNSAKLMNFSRTIGNNEDLNIQISTNNFLDPNDYYLLTIRQRERIIYNETLKLTKGAPLIKTIKANQFNLTLGGILTLNLYKITENYFLFQNTTNATICDQNMIEQLMSNGTLVIQNNGQITYNNSDVTYHQYNLSQSTLNQSNLTSNSTIQLPYTPINDQNCVLLNLDQVVSFLEQRASINFFKRPSTNVSVEINTNKNNYMQGEQVNATVTVRNKATGTIITDPGFLYVSATEDAELFDNTTADLPTQVYLMNDINENQINFLNPAKSLGQYFGNNGSSSNDSAFEFIMVTQQLRYYTFEMEYYQFMTRNLSFGVGGDLVVTDIIGQNQLYGLNFMRDIVPQQQQEVLYRFIDLMSPVQQEDQPTYGPYLPYRRTFSPADYLPQQSGIITGQNWTHNTSATYNRSANLDWTETLFWGSGISVVGGKANITFKTSDLSTNYRIQANYYAPSQGVATSFKRFSVGKAFKFSFQMPDRMAVGDSYNATLTFENFSPNNLTIRPFPLSVDYSIQIKGVNGTDLSLVSFNATANMTTVVQVVVTPMKQSPQARIVLSARANDSFNKYEEFDEETAVIFNQALARTTVYAGMISTNTSDNSSMTNITVRFPDSSTFNTTTGQLYIFSSMFGQLLYTLDLLAMKQPETSDDCISRIDIYGQTIDRYRQLSDSYQNVQILGIVQELQYKQFQLIKQLNNFIINSGTTQNPFYLGYDQFPYDNSIKTTKTGSISVAAFNIFVNKINNGINKYDGVNKTNDQHLRYILGRKSTNYNQNSTDSDITYKTNSTTTNAFVLTCLAGAQFSNGTYVNITDDLAKLVSSVNASFKFNETAFVNITSDAYQLALTILAVVSSNPANVSQATRNATLNFLAPQLAKHYNATTGAFDISPKTVNTTSSPMNSVDNDRLVEQTSFAVIALGSTNFTQYSVQLMGAQKFLKSQNPANMIQNTFAILILSRALSLLDSVNGFNSQDAVVASVSYNGTLIEEAPIQGPNAIANLTLDINDPYYSANSTGNFTIQVTQSNISTTKQIYYLAVWSYLDNNYTGVAPRANDLNVTVAANYTQALVRDKQATNVTLYGYTVTIVNNDPIRSSSALVVTLRLPACLQTDNGLIRSSLSANKNVIGDINNQDDQNSVEINVKPVASKGTVSFTLSARQIGQGQCKMGYVTFKNRNSPTVYSVRPNY